jgi:tetratricopeptide (TPR) repeat protein
LLQDLGRFDEAKRVYLDALNHHGKERHFSSIDRALTGYKTRRNMAVLALDTGDLAEAEQHWCEMVRSVPYYPQGWRGLSETMLRAGRFAELDALADHMSGIGELRIEGLLVRSRLAKARGLLQEARIALDRAIAERPDDWATLCERSRVLFDRRERKDG